MHFGSLKQPADITTLNCDSIATSISHLKDVFCLVQYYDNCIAVGDGSLPAERAGHAADEQFAEGFRLGSSRLSRYSRLCGGAYCGNIRSISGLRTALEDGRAGD